MKPKVIGIGELLWDMLPSGPRMGGAPANFACHAGALGARAAVISRVGEDDAGYELVRNLAACGVATDGVSYDAAHATGSVQVSLGSKGEPCYEIMPDVAWDHITHTTDLERLVSDADVLCFGSLGQRSIHSRTAIRELIAYAPATALKIFDINLRQSFYDVEIIESSLNLANVLKLNDEELPIIASLLGMQGEPLELLKQLLIRHHLQLVVYTCGAKGSLLVSATQCIQQAALPTHVRDSVGAGDSFTAAVSMGLIADWSLQRIAQCANEIAAYVCSQDGAVPPLPQILREKF